MTSSITHNFLDGWASVASAFSSPTDAQVVDDVLVATWSAITPPGGGVVTYFLYRDDVYKTTTFTFTDNGDGTWTAVSSPEDSIIFGANGYFELKGPHARMVDSVTYEAVDTIRSGLFLTESANTTAIIDTTMWSESQSAQLRVDTYVDGVFLNERYSPFFTLAHAKPVVVGDSAPNAIYLGNSLVSAIYIGDLKVW